MLTELLPAGLAAMSLLFLLSGPKMRHVAPINMKFGLRSAPLCQISHLSGQKCGNTGPKTVKILNFAQKFVPQGRLVCNIFTKFSVFVYR